MAAVPPFALQRPSAGVPVRYVPSLHRIVAPAGACGAARDASRGPVTSVVPGAAWRPAAGGAERWGSVTSTPPWLAQPVGVEVA